MFAMYLICATVVGWLILSAIDSEKQLSELNGVRCGSDFYHNYSYDERCYIWNNATEGEKRDLQMMGINGPDYMDWN